MRYTKETLFKVLGENGESYHGGSGVWFLPRGKRPGKWMPRIDDPLCCERGYHVVRGAQLVEWLGPILWVVEVRGESHVEADKSAWSEARLLSRVESWNERTARLFACDCAERVVDRYDDERSRAAIDVSRRFANGKATRDELVAAWDAASAAAWAAASAAERAWQTDRLLAYLNGEV